MHILVHFMIFISLSIFLSIRGFSAPRLGKVLVPAVAAVPAALGEPGEASANMSFNAAASWLRWTSQFLARLCGPRKVGVFDPYKWDDDDDDVYMILSNDHLIS